MIFNDNDDERRLFENCIVKGKRVVNPIIDWSDSDVWNFIKCNGLMHGMKYCSLYDEGFERLGCIGCPMSCSRTREFERWPKYYLNYYKAIQRFLPGYLERCKTTKREPYKKTAQEWMDWWIYEMPKENPDQLKMFDEDDFI